MSTAKLQQALARAGVASRRRAEDLIRSGRVTVNGVTAKIGMRVDPLEDVIAVDRERIRTGDPVWIALHKPVGYIVSGGNARTHQTVFELVPPVPGLTYVGRLDVMTSGLLLMTTDGTTANRLTHPRYGVEREYRAVVHGRAIGEIRAALRRPIWLEGRQVRIVRSSARSLKSGSSDLSLVLAEGRYRIIRRICDQLGLSVEQLKRVSHGPISLGHLPSGHWRYLTGRELEALAELCAA
jgi:23S rRNA pseudouridine2605 synthase